MLAVRVAWVLALPEIDSDAYGHFGIAIATGVLHLFDSQARVEAA